MYCQAPGPGQVQVLVKVKVQVKVPVSNKFKIYISESKIGNLRDTIIKFPHRHATATSKLF